MNPPTRVVNALAGAWCLVLALVYTLLLVLNPEDNAYPWVLNIGQMLFLVGMAHICCALARGNLRLVFWWVSMAGLWFVGLVGGGLLLFALALIPGQGYTDDRVLWVHILALVGLAATVYGIAFRMPRDVFE
jgi:hypothetical protein